MSKPDDFDNQLGGAVTSLKPYIIVLALGAFVYFAFQDSGQSVQHNVAKDVQHRLDVIRYHAIQYNILSAKNFRQKEWDYLSEHLHPTKICKDAQSEGCFGAITECSGRGLILPGGASIAEYTGPINSDQFATASVCIDFNGPQEPNKAGEDVSVYEFTYGLK